MKEEKEAILLDTKESIIWILLVLVAGYLVILAKLLTSGERQYWITGFFFDKNKTIWWKLKIVGIQIVLLFGVIWLLVLLKSVIGI